MSKLNQIKDRVQGVRESYDVYVGALYDPNKSYKAYDTAIFPSGNELMATRDLAPGDQSSSAWTSLPRALQDMLGVEGDPTDPASSNYDPTAVADPNATQDPTQDPAAAADAAAAAAAPGGDVRIKVQPIDAVVYDGSKGTPRKCFGSCNRFFNPTNGYMWGYDNINWPNSNNPIRWIANRGMNNGVGRGWPNWDEVTATELADLQGASLKAGWGPLIGNPQMPDFANLHWAEDTKNWFWYPSQAPAWSTAEANAALAATNKQTADTLAAALAAQQALDQQQAQTDAHDVAVATAAASKQSQLQAIQDTTDQGVQASADAKAQAAAATQAAADEASAQHDANVQAIQDANDAKKQAVQDALDAKKQAADDAQYQKQQDALSKQYELQQMQQVVSQGPRAQAQDDSEQDPMSDSSDADPMSDDSSVQDDSAQDDSVMGDFSSVARLRRLRKSR